MPKPAKITAKTGGARHWLVKTEPESFSIHDLAQSKNQTTCWNGVRNYQARNFLRDEMKVGDRVLFYHSSTNPAGIAGIARVVRAGYPDHTALDKKHQDYDPKSTPDNPIWFMVDLRLETIFAEPLTLESLRAIPALREMELLRRGSRLSVQPVREQEFQTILRLASAPSRKREPRSTSGKSRSMNNSAVAMKEKMRK